MSPGLCRIHISWKVPPVTPAHPDIPVRDRLMVALDLSDGAAAGKLVEQLGDTITFYKLGLELLMSDDYWQLVDWLTGRGKKVFADIKFFDVPATVGRAVKRLSERNVAFVTVHGNDAIMAAAGANKGAMRVLAVTVLTSLDDGDMRDLGFDCNIPELVQSRARRAIKLGCDGVVASGREAPVLRKALGDAPVIVTPGIRDTPSGDDQKRTVGVEEAFQNGADYIVMGRPIRDADDPATVARAIQARITSLFGG